MYKILYIESGDYLYKDKKGIGDYLIYSIYETFKYGKSAFIPIIGTKEELSNLLLTQHTIKDITNSTISLDLNQNLFEIIEVPDNV